LLHVNTSKLFCGRLGYQLQGSVYSRHNFGKDF
jgi:hypothetical protein